MTLPAAACIQVQVSTDVDDAETGDNVNLLVLKVRFAAIGIPSADHGNTQQQSVLFISYTAVGLSVVTSMLRRIFCSRR